MTRQSSGQAKLHGRLLVSATGPQGEPLLGEPLPGEPLLGEPLQGEPLQGEPLLGEPLLLLHSLRMAHRPLLTWRMHCRASTVLASVSTHDKACVCRRGGAGGWPGEGGGEGRVAR